MSTRATIHFLLDGSDESRAVIYRHGDGDGLGAELSLFLDELQANLSDTRFNDPSYLAAKWVVWDASRHHLPNALHLCDFLSVGVVLTDPPDIAYRYLVICGAGYGCVKRPVIICQKLGCLNAKGVRSIKRKTTIKREDSATRTATAL